MGWPMLDYQIERVRRKLAKWILGDIPIELRESKIRQRLDHASSVAENNRLLDRIHEIERRVLTHENCLKMVALESAYKAVKEAGEKL